MESHKIYPIKKSKKSYRVARPTQTGFSSPATHYSEPRIDLNSELLNNPSSSFFIRISDDGFSDFGIDQNDVLIIDRALSPLPHQLALVIESGEFNIKRIGIESSEPIELWGVITYIIKSAL